MLSSIIPATHRPTISNQGQLEFNAVFSTDLIKYNKPTRSTQPCIPPGSHNRVPASAGVRAGMSPLPGGR